MWSRIAVVSTLLASCHAGLLGAGTGEGSCAAAPFRAAPAALKWSVCPPNAACCSEFGYCRPRSEWLGGLFRDCNGESNGRPLEEAAVIAERTAAANGDTAGLALLGPLDTARVAAAPAPIVAAAPGPVAIAAPAPAAALSFAPGAGVAVAGGNGVAVAGGAPGVTYAVNGATGATLVNGLALGANGLALGGAGGALVGAGGALVGGASGLALGANGLALGGRGVALNGVALGANGGLALGANGVALNGGALTANGYAVSGDLAALWDNHFGGSYKVAAAPAVSAGGYLPPAAYTYAKH